jgi:twitching motility protein PilT
MESFESLFQQAAWMRASDLHLSVGIPPMGRVDGKLIPVVEHICTPEDVQEIAYSIMDERMQKVFEEKGEVDFAYGIPNVGRYRLNVFRQKGYCALAARILNDFIPLLQKQFVPIVIILFENSTFSNEPQFSNVLSFNIFTLSGIFMFVKS